MPYSQNFLNDRISNNANELFAVTIILALLTLAVYKLLCSKSVSSNVKINLLKAYDKTVDELKNDYYTPWNKSTSNGVQNGVFSYFRRSTEDEELKISLNCAKNDAAAKATIVRYFKNTPNLWNKSNIDSEHFSNHFFCQLSKMNISLSREILEDGRGIKLCKGAITLYRRDTRGSEIIFKEGFKLKETENDAAGGKYIATEPVTWAYGVSTSDKIPPNGYGCEGYYTIEIPENHSLLIIDIVNSPKNKNKLTPYQKELREFNVLHDIPPEYIKSYTYQNKTIWCGLFHPVESNNKFKPEEYEHQHIPHGCYT